MIVSKPKISTLFSLVFFIILAYGLAIFMLVRIFQNPGGPWWQAVVLGISGGVALAVSYKTLSGYKKVLVSKNRMDIQFAFNWFHRRYYFKELQYWQEESIKTATGTFKELSLSFGPRKKVRLSWQEQDNYGKIKMFLIRNFKAKQRKT